MVYFPLNVQANNSLKISLESLVSLNRKNQDAYRELFRSFVYQMRAEGGLGAVLSKQTMQDFVILVSWSISSRPLFVRGNPGERAIIAYESFRQGTSVSKESILKETAKYLRLHVPRMQVTIPLDAKWNHAEIVLPDGVKVEKTAQNYSETLERISETRMHSSIPHPGNVGVSADVIAKVSPDGPQYTFGWIISAFSAILAFLITLDTLNGNANMAIIEAFLPLVAAVVGFLVTYPQHSLADKLQSFYRKAHQFVALAIIVATLFSLSSVAPVLLQTISWVTVLAFSYLLMSIEVVSFFVRKFHKKRPTSCCHFLALVGLCLTPAVVWWFGTMLIWPIWVVYALSITLLALAIGVLISMFMRHDENGRPLQETRG